MRWIFFRLITILLIVNVNAQVSCSCGLKYQHIQKTSDIDIAGGSEPLILNTSTDGIKVKYSISKNKYCSDSLFFIDFSKFVELAGVFDTTTSAWYAWNPAGIKFLIFDKDGYLLSGNKGLPNFKDPKDEIEYHLPKDSDTNTFKQITANFKAKEDKRPL